MSKQAILVTGGAGYIGSHVVKALGERGETIVVLDDLSSGFSEAVLYGTLVVGSINDKRLLQTIFTQYDITDIMHLAAYTSVEESVRNPIKYLNNNVSGTINLLQAASESAMTRHFVFSSSAAVYGNPSNELVNEQEPVHPVNPYGVSKLFCEYAVNEFSRASLKSAVNLRYFNVAGADPDGELGQSTLHATTLIKLVAECLAGKREKIEIYGDDYPTPDGTGIRDYIHVSDIAQAHLAALDYLRAGGETITLNCGYGHGYSVLDVIKAAQRIADKKIPVQQVARRPGDPAAVVADNTLIKNVFFWEPRFDNLDFMVKTAWEWEMQ